MASPTRVKLIGALLLVGVLAGGGYALATQTAIDQPPPREVEISANRVLWNPADWKETQTGKLRFVTGLALTSGDPAFGGLSAFRLSPSGDFLAITDQGQWLAGKLTHDENGKATGIADARMAPILDANGNAIGDKLEADAESLAVTGSPPQSGTAFVGFEHHHRIESFDLGEEGLAARAVPFTPPIPAEGLDENGSLEAMTVLPGAGGRLLVFMEATRNADGDYLGYIAEDGTLRDISVATDPPFGITDMAFAPDGDLILVERRYSPAAGVGLKLKRIDGEAIKPGARLEGEVLLDVGNRYSIDNMEGVSVVEGPDGETFVYLLSDDNFNPLQRTLLLQFELAD